MDENFRIESTSLLTVEGKDECNFFKALLEHQNINKVQLVDIGGKDKFKYEFPALYNLEGFNKIERLGFIRDAETNQAQSAFDSICSILRQSNLPIPDHLNTITSISSPHIGIFIMPNNSGTGMLEDLCLDTIKNLPVNTCIDDFVECFIKNQIKKEKPLFNESKYRVQAYLATRSPIRNSLGLGALKGYWDFEHSCFNDIKKFLTILFP